MSRRRRKHEDHTNHEAWAIPYGDLMTLLLAFFVVMYAISSLNEGKYRILSDSLVAAFRGTPRTLEPVQVGEKQVGSGADLKVSLVEQGTLEGQPRQLLEAVPIENAHPLRNGPRRAGGAGQPLPGTTAADEAMLRKVADEVEQAMQDLVERKQVLVRRYVDRVEVEIRTDILFQSASADLSPHAQAIIGRLAVALARFPNPVRVEGHTDNVPIHTRAYPSNWELSAARAATVVHIMSERGIEPARLAVLGYGEFRPAKPNDSAEGRNMNRRVLLVVTGVGEAPEVAVAPAAIVAQPVSP
jgi:chemotaxis protein MotB